MIQMIIIQVVNSDKSWQWQCSRSSQDVESVDLRYIHRGCRCPIVNQNSLARYAMLRGSTRLTNSCAAKMLEEGKSHLFIFDQSRGKRWMQPVTIERDKTFASPWFGSVGGVLHGGRSWIEWR